MNPHLHHRRPDKRSVIRQPSPQVGAAYRSGKAAVPDGACGLSGLRGRLKARIPFLEINQEREFPYAGMAERARQLALSMNSPVGAAMNTFNRIGRRPDKRSAIRQPSPHAGAACRSGKAAVPDGACGLSGLRSRLKARIPFPGINQEREFAYAGMAELAHQLALSMNSPVGAAMNTFNRIGRRPDKRSAIRQPSPHAGAACRSGKAAAPDGACGLSGLRGLSDSIHSSDPVSEVSHG